MKKYLITGLFGIILSASLCAQKQSNPNFIIILTDDQGYQDVGCFGSPNIKTPNLDKIADEGMKFTSFYAQTVCGPSRAALMTGCYPLRIARNDDGEQPHPNMALSEVTIAEMLKPAGYATCMFGKWGLGYVGSEGDPKQQGFDEFYGYLHQSLAHNYYPYHLWHNGEKIVLEGNMGHQQTQYAPELLHKEAMKFLENNKDTSFFLYYPSIIPHAELFAPKVYLEKHRGKYLPEKEYKGRDSGKGYKNGNYGSQKESHAAFAAMINLLDDQVGEIVAKVTELGIAENTIIIFSSDNGAHAEGGADPKFFNSTAGLRGIKRDLYEGGVRVPMIVKWPGKIKAGCESEHISAFWDVLPTLSDIAEATTPNSIDGISFLPELLGKKQKKHNHLYWEFYEKEGRQAVRKGQWKAVRYKVAHDYEATPVELYNLKEDPFEEHNLSVQFPKIAAEMLKLIKDCHSPSENFVFKEKIK